MFRGKRALLALMTGGQADAYPPDGFNGDIHGILRPVHRGMLRFVGFDMLAPHIVYGPIRLSDDERRRELERFADRLRGDRRGTADRGRALPTRRGSASRPGRRGSAADSRWERPLRATRQCLCDPARTAGQGSPEARRDAQKSVTTTLIPSSGPRSKVLPLNRPTLPIISTT